MYTYTHIYMCILMDMCIYIYVCIYIHIQMYMYVYTRIQYMYIYVYIYVFTGTYIIVQIYTSIFIYLSTLIHIHRYTHVHTYTGMGWLRLVGSLKWQVSFAEYRLFYRALLQKRPIIVRSLLTIATPYMHLDLHMYTFVNHAYVCEICTPTCIYTGTYIYICLDTRTHTYTYPPTLLPNPQRDSHIQTKPIFKQNIPYSNKTSHLTFHDVNIISKKNNVS